MTRIVENRVEVPGTPEEVWEAIATGHGIETWFVPAEVEPRVGGRVRLDMGSGLEDSGLVTEWSPPHRFAYEEEWAAVEGEPPGRMASEFIVEALQGGTCVVRLVSTLHDGGDGWDAVLEEMRGGWDAYFLVLRLYRTHFAGLPCTTVLVTRKESIPRAQATAELFAALELEDAAPGEHVEAPRLAGFVEQRDEHELILRLTEPSPGVGIVYTYAWGDQVAISVHLYLYGETSADPAEWRDWMSVTSPR